MALRLSTSGWPSRTSSRRPDTGRIIPGAAIVAAFTAIFGLVGVGCGRTPRYAASATPVGSGTNIGVMRFATESASIENYQGPPGAVGDALSAAIANALRGRGASANVIRDGVPVEAQAIVSGRVTRIYGGSQSKRAILGMGAGHAMFAVAGEVRRPDGTVIGTFSEQRGSIGRVGYGGGSNEFVISLCIERVGEDIAEMVSTGSYSGGTAIVQGQPPPPTARAGARPAAERLRELDTLKAQGLINDKEYEDKRRRIIEEF